MSGLIYEKIQSYRFIRERRGAYNYRSSLKEGGKVITFGYHSNTMGAGRGFTVEKVCLFSHGGAIHDTIASVERHCR